MKEIWLRIVAQAKSLANLHDDTNIEATINSIKKGIEFKGPNVWILAFAIIVASVGLNVNSTAVIIGAMLISPLMGPINGIGLAMGIADMDLLKHSLWNLLTMVLISLIASTTYFLLSPLSDAQSELLARTTPTIYDVLIAFFGGMAGIVALSRKEQSITIISGVAIATALMPPLCTAGFGLAGGEFKYFFGAFYLFSINSCFIALATFLMVRYLKFPQKQYLDDKKSKLVKRGITLFAIVVIVPSVLTAISVIRETSFNSSAIKYINSIQNNALYSDVEIVNTRREYSRKQQKIFISFVGKQLTDNQTAFLHTQLKEFGLSDVQLEIKQTGGTLDLGAQTGIIADLLNKKEIQLQRQDSTIERMAFELEKIHGSGPMLRQVAQEVMVQYPEVESFSVVNAIYTHTQDLRQDTIPVLFVNWAKQPADSLADDKLAEWLRVRLQLSQLEVHSVAMQ